jgi:D-alanine transaminase
MSRIVYVNGAFLPEEEAKVSVFDRGFLFADGVYEVTPILNGRLIENPPHMARLQRSLDALKMPSPVPLAEIPAIMEELVRRNGVEEGTIYLQVTRGAADRDFVFPDEPKPSLVMFTQARNIRDTKAAREGVRVVSMPDIRWGRRDIKTVQLLAASMAKTAAKEAGVDDAWMVQDGFVTEGTSNNVWIVTREGVLVTRQLSTEILHGITRGAVMKLAAEAQLRVEERPFTVAEAQAAAEAFYTSASAFVTPVVEVDGVRLGEGRPGPVARRLREIYLDAAAAEAAA